MSIARRQLLIGLASVIGCRSIHLKGLAQSAASSVVTPDFGPVPAPSTQAAKALFNEIGATSWTELNDRLNTVNLDIQLRGLRHIPGISGTFLTGYPYNEFYDWDLYFENLYLSYFGVWPFCFTNLKAFLDRQAPDGYVNRSLIKQRDRQHFKPFLAQLAVLGCKQDGNDYEWLRGNYYVRLKKYLDKWFSYDGDGNGLPVWNSGTPPAPTTNGAGPAGSRRFQLKDPTLRPT